MIDENYLKHEYLELNRDMVDIANELGVSRGSVWYYLKKYSMLHSDIKKNKNDKKSYK